MSETAINVVSGEDWQAILAEHGGDAPAAARNLIEKGVLNARDWCVLRASQLGWPHDPAPDLSRLAPGFARRLGFSQARRLGILPVCEQNGRVLVWVRPDIDWACLLELQAVFGAEIDPVIIDETMFNRALQHAHERSGTAIDAVQSLDDSMDLGALSASLPLSEDLLDSEDDAPVIRFLNALMTQAIEEEASDIHVEPFESRAVFRYRVDGILRDVVDVPGILSGRIAARIKVMARLNIAEKRIPQDGRISVRLGGRAVDMRVSTLPTQYGERVVMRLLEKEKGPLKFDQIGMPEDIQQEVSRLIHAPHGIFLVTGPTGSGKTTTLYAALQAVHHPDVNIITVEDPVEYDLQGIGQIPVNVKTGMTFARGLRAILRQDPDIIMVGEIRDLETAEVAVQASLTGHRVFSTLHTNDAAGSITRLIDMGVESYLVASGLLGVMAQRLVRKLCRQCRVAAEADTAECRLLGCDPVTRPVLYCPQGCEACGDTGYRGRTGIYELLVVDEAIRQLIHEGKGERALREVARSRRIRSLRDDGLHKALEGVTSLEEVLRVAQS